MRHPLTCGILAGGASSRMGAAKALLPFRGKPMLSRQIDVLSPLFERIVVSAIDPEPYRPFGLEIIPDLFPERCPLAGLHAVLSSCRTGHAFIVACDLPFLNPDAVEFLLGLRDRADVVIPETARGLEPLHAVYARRCLPAIEEAARDGRWKMTGYHSKVSVHRVRMDRPEWEVEGRSPFENVNTPEEFRAAGP